MGFLRTEAARKAQDPLFADVVVPLGVVACWRLSNDRDSVGSHHLSFTGTPVHVPSLAGPNGKGLDCSGGAYATAADHADFDSAAGFLAGLIKPASQHQAWPINRDAAGENATDVLIRCNADGSLTGALRGQAGDEITTEAGYYVAGQEVAVLIGWSTSGYEFWADATLIGTSTSVTGGTVGGSAPVLIGRDGADTVTFNGVIDEVVWGNFMPSAADIFKLANLGDVLP